jgi:hypothetical protein
MGQGFLFPFDAHECTSLSDAWGELKLAHRLLILRSERAPSGQSCRRDRTAPLLIVCIFYFIMNKACSERVVRGISNASSLHRTERTLNSCCDRGVVAKIVGERARRDPLLWCWPCLYYMQRVRFSPTPAAHMHNLLELQPSCFAALTCVLLLQLDHNQLSFFIKAVTPQLNAINIIWNANDTVHVTNRYAFFAKLQRLLFCCWTLQLAILVRS